MNACSGGRLAAKSHAAFGCLSAPLQLESLVRLRLLYARCHTSPHWRCRSQFGQVTLSLLVWVQAHFQRLGRTCILYVTLPSTELCSSSGHPDKVAFLFVFVLPGGVHACVFWSGAAHSLHITTYSPGSCPACTHKSFCLPRQAGLHVVCCTTRA